MSNYASWGKHAKHRNILAVNLPDTFRCPKRQIATKKYKIICLSSMCYLKQKKSNAKYNLRTAFSRFAPQLTIRFKHGFFWPFSYGVTHLLRKQYPYIWLPFQYHSNYHSIFVIYVCRISAAIIQRSTQVCWVSFSNASDISLFTFHSQIRYPGRTKFHAIFSLFLTKCSASREAVVSINFSVSSENQNNQIRMKKGKHSGITFCPDSYKNEKKNLHLVDVKEEMVFDLFEPKSGGRGGCYHI